PTPALRPPEPPPVPNGRSGMMTKTTKSKNASSLVNRSSQRLRKSQSSQSHKKSHPKSEPRSFHRSPTNRSPTVSRRLPLHKNLLPISELKHVPNNARHRLSRPRRRRSPPPMQAMPSNTPMSRSVPPWAVGLPASCWLLYCSAPLLLVSNSWVHLAKKKINLSLKNQPRNNQPRTKSLSNLRK